MKEKVCKNSAGDDLECFLSSPNHDSRTLAAGETRLAPSEPPQSALQNASQERPETLDRSAVVDSNVEATPVDASLQVPEDPELTTAMLGQAELWEEDPLPSI